MPSKKLRKRERHDLLHKLRDNPHLPAFVERLDAPVLNRLIEHIGLEDAGAVIEYASTRQLQEILDERLWTNRHPGDPETLATDEFLRWLETWNEIRKGFAAEKLLELGESFTVLCLSHLVTVVSTQIPYARFLGRDYTSEDFGEFVVRAKRPEQWDPIIETLNALWNEDPVFLKGILQQCCFEHSVLSLAGEDDRKELLHKDAAGAREHDREARGFVTPLSASMFLGSAKDADLEALARTEEYDLETARYFRLRAAKAAHADDPTEAQSDDPVENDADDAPPPPDVSEGFADLEKALIDAEIVQTRGPQLLLAGPDADSGDTLTLKRALDTLNAERPDAFAARLAELGYLSNILMTGCEHRGRRFEESEAAEATLAICNLGLGYLHGASAPNADELSFFSSQLAAPPALVKAFQLGWNLTYKLPLRTIARLFETLYSPEMKKKLASHPWLSAQVDDALPKLRLAYISGDGAGEAVREIVVMLGLVFDHTVCQCLTASVDSLPSYPVALEDDGPTVKVNTATRFIASMADLHSFDAFLASLPDRVSI
jgi:hypothetical protein